MSSAMPGTAVVSLSIAMARFHDLWPFRFRNNNARAAGPSARLPQSLLTANAV